MKRLIFIVFFCMLSTTGILAQKIFGGKVIEEDSGLGLPGVSIVLKSDKTIGVATDVYGRWRLSVPSENSILVFTSVGMKTVELAAKDARSVIMESTVEVLDNVIVTGYSTVKRKSLTGSSKSLKSDVLELKTVSNISKALSGEISGVHVLNTSGQPGSSAKVRIRGFSSVDGVNAPLYVVDGIPYEGNMNTINQSDIESITVLKDASATALYGSRGSNGVIVITTRKGKSGVYSVEVESKTGFAMELIDRYDMISSPEEYTELSWDILRRKGEIYAPAGITDEQIRELTSEYLFSNDINNGVIPNFYNMWNQRGTDLIDPTTGKLKPNITRRYTPESYDDHLFETGVRNEVSLKLTGGNEKTKYYTSAGYLDDNGYAKKTSFSRISTRLNLSHNVKDWLKGNVNMSFVTSKNRGVAGLDGKYSSNPFFFAKNVAPIYPVYERDIAGKKIKEPYYGGYLYDMGFGIGRPSRPFANDTNPLSSIAYDYNEGKDSQFVGNFYLEAKILEGLKLSSRIGVEYINSDGIVRNNPFYGGKAPANGTISKSGTQIRTYTWTKMLTYDKEANGHKFNAILAHENSELDYKYSYAEKSNLVNPFGKDLDAAIKDEGKATSYTNGYALESYFGQLNYEYFHKYIASLTFRRDGSSKFTEKKWDNFGAIGFAWRVTQEDFLYDSKILEELKLRFSYGITGNQGTAVTGLRVYYANQEIYGIGNLAGNPTLNLNLKGNPDLTWETSRMLQIGTDFNIAGIVEGTFDFYVKNTDGMFYDKRGGISLGYAFVKVNDGRMRNSGFEFDFNTHIINTDDMKLDFTLNGEMIKNKITAMPVDDATRKRVILNGHLSKGKSFYNYYMPEWAGVNKDTGKAQWISYYDDKNKNNTRDAGETIRSMTLYLGQNRNANVKKDITEKYYEATQKYVDKYSVPNVRGAFGIHFDYKGISLSTQFLYGLGGYIYDGEYASYMSDTSIGALNYHVDVRNRWQKPGDVTNIPRFTGGADSDATAYSTRFLTKMDYLALNNIKIGYTIPTKYIEKFRIKELSVFLSGDNLWVGSHRKGFNPTTYGETNDVTYNPLSTITLGFNIKL